MKFKIRFTYIGFGLLVLILSGCSLLPEKTVGEKVAPSVAREQTKEYRSEFMKISLRIPKDWVVEDKQIGLNIISSKGKIGLGRSGTNWDNLTEFVDDLDLKYKLQVSNRKFEKINNNDAISRIEINNTKKEEKVYYIYTNNLVFTLSTSTPELYNDLDKIAQSFRYFGK